MNEWDTWAAACCCCLPHQSCSSIFMLSNTQAAAAAGWSPRLLRLMTLHGREWPLLLTAISCCNTWWILINSLHSYHKGGRPGVRLYTTVKCSVLRNGLCLRLWVGRGSAMMAVVCWLLRLHGSFRCRMPTLSCLVLTTLTCHLAISSLVMKCIRRCFASTNFCSPMAKMAISR